MMNTNKNQVVVLFGKSLMIEVHDEFYEVNLFRDIDSLIVDTGYIFNGSDIVYVYRGKFTKESKAPGIYLKNGKLHFIEPSDRRVFSIFNIKEYSPERIFDEITKNMDSFISPEDIEIINNNSEKFIPTIKDSDDFLKVIIKKAIIDKKINLKNYKDSFKNQHMLTNLKSALGKSTKMTVTNFKIWCEALGLNWEIVITDSGADKISPLEDDIIVTNFDLWSDN